MNEEHEKFMRLAIDKAYEGIGKGEFPFGCCLRYQDDVMVTHNKCISLCNPLAHAEIMAINHICEKNRTFNLSGGVLYATTEPCMMCAGAIKWVNISCVVYGTPIKSSSDLGFDETNISILEVNKENNHIHIISEFMKFECEKVLMRWKEKDNIYRRISRNNRL